MEPDAQYLDAVKSRLSPRASGLIGLEKELMREAAATLGRQGERLERAFERLRELELAFARTPSPALVSQHEDARAEAERLLLHLKIQREALGLRNHGELEHRYPLPRFLCMPRE